MFSRRCFLFTIVTILFAKSTAVQPGFQARITPKGLQFLTEAGIRELQDDVSKATIPDQSGSADVRGIGKLDYTVSNMHVTSFNIPSASISTKTGVGVTVSASGLNLALHGDWKYKLHSFIHVSDHGSFDVSLSDVSITVTIEIGMDSTGHPTVHSSSDDCSFRVGGADVHFHGGASWLYNLFDDTIADKIKDALNDQVCQIVLKEVNTDLAQEVANIQMVASISDDAEVDYSLVATPVFNASLTTFHKGEVYQKGHHTEAPYPVPTIPPDGDESKMVFMWMTDYAANSAGYVLQNTGFFKYNVTQDKIPPGSKISLNTSDFAVKFLIPQISKLYPNMMMQINLNTTSPPVVNITPNDVGGVVNGDIAAYVILPNKTLAYLFTLAANMKVSAALGFHQSNITWNSTYVSADLKLIDSAIDDFNVDLLRTSLQAACKLYIIPRLNEMGKYGIPVPNLDSYAFQDPVIVQGKGFIKIGTDMAYQPGWRKGNKNEQGPKNHDIRDI